MTVALSARARAVLNESEFLRDYRKGHRGQMSAVDQRNAIELNRVLEFCSGSAPRAESDRARSPAFASSSHIEPSTADPSR